MHKNPVIQMLLRLPSVHIGPEKASDEEKATHIIYPAVDPQPEDYARPTFRRDHVQLVLLLGIVRYVGFEHVRSAEQHTGQSAIDRGPSASSVTNPEEYFVVQHRPAGIFTQPSYSESLCGVARQHQQRALHRIAVVRKQEVPTTASWPTLAKVPRLAVDSSNSFEQFNSRSSIQQIWFTGGGRWSHLSVKIALETVVLTQNNGIKFAKAEKIPGGSIDELFTLRGFLLNKDEKPQIFLLDCPLEGGKAKAKPTWRL
ncbi:hypothetical protein quinque_013918 [Culex quinquefasciatus]